MENENAVKIKESKPKQKKKKGKIAQVYALHQKGNTVREIAEKMRLNERVVRAYIWRLANREKYSALLKRYFEKKRGKEKPAAEDIEKPVEAEKSEKKKK